MPDLNDLVDPNDQYTGEEEQPIEEPKGDVPEEPQEEELETPLEEQPEGEVPQEQPQVDPVTARFKELGLDRQFPGGVDDMLNRMPYMNKWQTQLSQENADLKKKLEERQRTEQQQQYDPETFYQDPDSYLGQKYATKEEIAAMQNQMRSYQDQAFADRYNRFADSHTDFRQLEPVMQQILLDDPGYNNLRDPLSSLYNEAKRRTAHYAQAAVQATQEKVSAETSKEKVRASTEGSGAKPKSRKLNKDDLYKMSVPELEKLMGFSEEEDY